MDKKDKVLVKQINLEGKEVKLEFKHLPISNIKILDASLGIIEAYVSIFGNVDSYGDVVEKGAFAASIAKHFPRYPKGVWAHDWSQPIAKTLEIKEDQQGLYVKGQLLLDIQKAKEAYILIKEGVVTDFSFGYEVDEAVIDESTGVRLLKKLTIYEWSPVLVGANDRATLLRVKSDGQEASAENTEELLDDEDEDDPEKDNKETEEKIGRVLSEANRSLIKTAMDEIVVLVTGLNDIFKMFEALYRATEQPPGKEGNTVVEQRDRSKVIKNLWLRDARQAVKAGNRLILRIKKEIIN